jgi:hypothetical protein
MHVPQTRQCDESGSATRNQEIGRGGEDGGPLDGATRAAVVVGVLTWRRPGHIVDLEQEHRRIQRGGEIEDRLGHRHKHVEKYRCARVRVHP